MEPVQLKKILHWCKGEVRDKQILERYCYGISTDTRSIKKKELFIALKGEKFDGTSFVNVALKNGAIAAVVPKTFQPENKKLIWVKDTLKALGDIAKNYRKEFSVYVIGITGSDGKTTTKEFLKKTLSMRYSVCGTEGNLNNAIGLPLSIFTINKKTDICILEMGMNRKNEIKYLGQIAKPQAGVITTVGPAHIGFFKNVREIAEAKSELIETLRGERLCVLNYDNRFFPFLKSKAPSNVLSFGTKEGADIKGTIMEEANDFFTFCIAGDKTLFRINFWNTSIIYPALISFGFGKKFGISGKEIQDIFEDIHPLPGRGKIYHLKDITVIDETYNSNPDSLKASLYNFHRKNFGRKIAVIGDMAELGRLSTLYHRNIGHFIKRLNMNIIITFGDKSREIGKSSGLQWKHFIDMEQLNKYLSCIIKKGDALLIKGSRVMNMDRVRDYLLEAYGG
ncbi:MAG: UDP-N-acetylmuramoyl-tripeptide--D-alanyl-D-alanine ligase [Candidatus Ratteibacteria bacterium]|nr:UDP-N-acetylmuramoyl-tripeptide--D-alanyl-D-alanine ligase [Candidatus Ratteibacteria bacterium]